jgi:hypothetical protein
MRSEGYEDGEEKSRRRREKEGEKLGRAQTKEEVKPPHETLEDGIH